MKKYKHIIISRVAMKWYDENGELICKSKLGLTWEEWLKNSIRLYDTYCRPSLKNQSNKNFILLTIVDESVVDVGPVLPNEHIIRIGQVSELGSAIEKFITKNVEERIYLLSRLDRDDCYSRDFVDSLQKKANEYLGKADEPSNFYFDIDHYNMYDPVTNVFTTAKYGDRTSPFTSILTDSPGIGIYSGHGRIKEKMMGTKVSSLEVLQIIHGENISNRVRGVAIPKTLINRKLLEYGIKKTPGFAIDSKLYGWVFRNILPGSTILELGSGYGTIDLAKRYKMISVENDPEWMNLTDKSKYIYAPLKGEWYDRSVLEKSLPGLTYDVILVDGPWIGEGNRTGFVENLDLFNTDVTMIFDDTHRADELAMCKAVSEKLGVPYQTFPGIKKRFSIIQNKKKLDEASDSNANVL
jgi:hypothetical protein